MSIISRRSIFAPLFIGSKRERMVRVHHSIQKPGQNGRSGEVPEPLEVLPEGIGQDAHEVER